MDIQNPMKPLRQVFWFGDTTFVRLLLGVASLIFAIGLFAPDYLVPDSRFPVLRYLPWRELLGSLFLAYSVGIVWRLVDRAARVKWALIVNSLGSGLWVVASLSMFLAYRFTPGAALEGLLGICSLWVLYRTGLTPEIVTP